MKKFVMTVAAFMALGGLAFAGEAVVAPSGANSNPIGADYGGVDVATNSFFVGLATVPTAAGGQGINYIDFYASTTTVNKVNSTNKWRIYGVNWSTGNCSAGDFVSIQVSSSGATQAREIARIYNSVSISTGAGSSGSNYCGGFTYTRWPIRAYGNLFWGVNAGLGGAGPTVNPYNRADLMYWKEPD